MTRLELLTVLGLLGVVAALLMPAVGRMSADGRAALCLSNLRQIGVAVQLYTQDHGNRLPVIFDRPRLVNATPAGGLTTRIEIVLSNYLGGPKVLDCPADRERLFELTGSSYAWNSLLNGEDAGGLSVVGKHTDPHRIPLVFDKDRFHAARGPARAVNYLYVDGHLRNLLVLEGEDSTRF